MKDPTVSNGCTIQLGTGEFCDRPTDDRMPFPVCIHHALKIHFAVVDQAKDAPPPQATPRSHIQTCDIYYAQMDGLIKIGRSTDVGRRMKNYPPTAELLATERGPIQLERQRHKEFNHLLAHGNEWFTPGSDLLAHIASLAKPAVEAL